MSDYQDKCDAERIKEGLTVGHSQHPDNEKVRVMVEPFIVAMRVQLRALNTEIERLRSVCGSYYGANLDTRYCVEFNTATEQAHRLRRAIELLEGGK